MSEHDSDMEIVDGDNLPLSDAKIKLNIGSGRVRADGWVPIDRKLGTEAYPLPDEYGPNSVDEIRASHVLEHFPFSENINGTSVETVLSHWVDKLKVGGRIRISVPDVNKILGMFDDPLQLNYLFGGQTDADDIHKSGFNRNSLGALMTKCGLSRIAEFDGGDMPDTSRHPVSLNLEGYKSSKKTNADGIDVNIAAIMSIPRYGCNEHWGCTIDALMPFGIPVQRGTGAFWGNVLDNLFDSAVSDGLDWILTIDYDSIFTKHHVKSMLQMMASHPEIDALCPIQVRRQGDTPLATIEGQNKTKMIIGKPLKVTTAHFGLSLIRVESLKKIPQPWFFGIPNASGGFDDDKRDSNVTDRLLELRRWADIPDDNHGRLDADIWFWHLFRKYNLNVSLNTECRIGHLEEKVLVMNEDGSTESIYMSEFRRREGMHEQRKRT